jgi:cytochrome c-type biogenesis protein CcmH/NrfG
MRSTLLCLCSGLLSLNIVWAANLGAAAPAGSDMAQVQKLIAQKDWKSAVVTLEKYTKAHPSDAEGFNLLGFSLRQTKRYPEAIQNYLEALRLDPQHRGAHEYLGQAYVQTKELDKARALLSNLEKICGTNCEEYQDLKKAIDLAP